MSDESRKARVDIGVPTELMPPSHTGDNPSGRDPYAWLSDPSLLREPLGYQPSVTPTPTPSEAVVDDAPEGDGRSVPDSTPVYLQRSGVERRAAKDHHYGRFIAAGAAAATLVVVAVFGNKALGGNGEVQATSDLHKTQPTHVVSPTAQPTVSRPTPESTPTPVHHHRKQAKKAAVTTPTPTPTPEATSPTPVVPAVTAPAPVAPVVPHHTKPRRHKVAVPLTDAQLISQLSLGQELDLLTTVVVPDINEVLPNYAPTSGDLQLNLATMPLGGVVLKNVQPGDEGLLQSGFAEINKEAMLPLESFYADDAIANPTSDLQLSSVQRMFKDGVTLTQAKSLFAKHYTHLADSGVESVYVAADLPTSYNIRVRKLDHYRIVHRHHHRRRIPVYKWVTETKSINQQDALQFVLAKVRAAQTAGLKVVSGSFPGPSSETTPNPYALVQQLGAEMEVSTAVAAGDTQPAMTDSASYGSLRRLNAATELLTAPIKSPDGTVSALANLAVDSLIAGANQTIVQLPSSVHVADYLTASAKSAEQAITDHTLSRRTLDGRVLAHLATENVSAKTAVTTLDPHAKTVRYHWVRSKR